MKSPDVDVEALREEVRLLKESNARLKKLYDGVALELALLKKQLFGRKAERIHPQQAQLAFDLVTGALARLAQGDESAAADAQAALDQLRDDLSDDTDGNDSDDQSTKKAPTKPRKGHGRKPLSMTDLPVEEVVIEPAEVVAGVDAGDLVKIGADISEHIDRRPASLVRVRVVRPKYVVRGAEVPSDDAHQASDDVLPTSTIVQAAMPDRVLPRSNAGPGLLAHVLVSKYADHLPLHRQERIFKREGLSLSTSTLWDWSQGSTALLASIVEAMWADAQDAPLVLADATGVLVQAKEECKRAHFYVAVVPGRSVLYRFTHKNDGETVAGILGGFRGRIQVDASSVYHELFRQDPDRVEVGCWAHACRNFFKALDADRDGAVTGIGFIGLLYDAHNAACDPNGVVNGDVRRAKALPVLEKFRRWLEEQREHRQPDSLLVKACNYVINQWTPLSRFLDDGTLRMDNNPAELELRRQAVGRKNWIFLGSDTGAVANTTAVSLIASCAMHDIEPWAYLRDVLTILPVWNQRTVLDLAPHRWRQTLEQQETQRVLAAQRLMGRGGGHGKDDGTRAAMAS